MRIGLDWDGTVTEYPSALAVLAAHAAHTVILTLNEDLGLHEAASTLGLEPHRIDVVVCPASERYAYDLWKADEASARGLHLVIDDDPRVVEACLAAGIPALQVQRD